MRFDKLTDYVAVAVLGCGILYAATNVSIRNFLLAQEARQSDKDQSMTERGQVKSLLKNDHGDVDGILLENDLRIHFPPHMGERISAIVKAGDTIEVEGRSEVTPRGEKVFEITRLVQGKETIQIEHPQPKLRPKGPRDEQPMRAVGKVTEYARNPHGDVDGLILQDGTIVKFPPHQSRQLQKVVAVGDEVKVEGRRHVTREGEIHLHADLIKADERVIEREGPPPPHGPKGPKHAPGHEEDEGPTNADLLRELKAIRRLLEKQVQN